MLRSSARKATLRSALLCTGLLLTLSTLSACASTSDPVLRGLDFCETYTPVLDVDHPTVLRNNAIYFEFCLGGGQNV
jgi:hypothetical protein